MSKAARVWIDLAPYLGIGWVFVFAIGACAGIGSWLDARLATGRKLFIAGALLGIGLGFAHFFKVVLGLNQRKGK